jgi:hypothetical protein
MDWVISSIEGPQKPWRLRNLRSQSNPLFAPL